MNLKNLVQKKLQFICLPYSGGSGFAFQPLTNYWPESWNVYTVTYPGRGHRIHEPLLTRMDELKPKDYRYLSICF